MMKESRGAERHLRCGGCRPFVVGGVPGSGGRVLSASGLGQNVPSVFTGPVWKTPEQVFHGAGTRVAVRDAGG